MSFRRILTFKTDSVIATIFLFVGVLVLALTRQESKAPEKFLFKMVPPPPHIERFSFGYRDTIADTLWIRVIQDFDLCENAPDGKAGGTEVRGPTATCTKGWVFQMLDAITTLSPQWKLPYRTGGTLLSIMVDDREGAAIILEKGMKQFPTDYNMHYAAAYHYIYEIKNPKRAAETLLVAAANGGPSWFYSLAGKLYTQAGQAFLAKTVLEDALKDEHNEIGAKRLQKRLDEVNEVLRKSAAGELKEPASK